MFKNYIAASSSNLVKKDRKCNFNISSLHLKLMKTFAFPSQKSHFVRHFFTLYHTDDGKATPTIKGSTPFMHECVMMSEHLVHYLRSLVAKLKAQ
jgi:hypothetical protein